jgi:glycosyltransferase involved in cell wall biosynthesis
MKIAIISGAMVPVPPVKYGGTEQVIFYLIKGLLELGHEVVFVGTNDSKVECQIVPIVDRATFFPVHKNDIENFEKQTKKYNQKIKKIIKELAGTVDIFHSHGFDMTGFDKIPNVTTLHNTFNFQNIDQFVDHKDLNYVTISNNQQDALPELNYAGVVYNGENPSEFPFVAEPEDYVCFLGRFDRDKNPHLAIQLAINKGIKIKVAGKLDHLGDGYFEEQVKPYFDHPLVEFLGEVDFQQKVELLAKAKCNLHPTNFREPFGLTVLEAAYCGTPTLAVARGSMPELIEEGRTGILVEDFVEGYSQLDIAFELDRNYIATRSRALFNYQNMSKQYVKIYEKIIEDFKTKKD